MYGGANRSISIETVMLTYSAAAYADCGEAMIVTDGHVLDDARQVADKLRVAIRVVSAIASLTAAPPVARDRQPDRHVLSFGEIWDTHFVPLAGRVLIRPNGTTNEILKVDHAGLVRRTSNGRTQTRCFAGSVASLAGPRILGFRARGRRGRRFLAGACPKMAGRVAGFLPAGMEASEWQRRRVPPG